ncbi:hypothetical protein DF047_37795, partial [Burkholderia cenocepacia]
MTGFSKATPIVEGERVIQQSTSKEITRMLVSVVDHAL